MEESHSMRNEENAMKDGGSRKKEKLTAFTDAASLLSQLKHQEKELKHKRMWLMGLASQYDVKRFKSDLQMDESILPETILREDDLFYENVRKYVEKGFGASPAAVDLPVQNDCKEPFQNSNMRKTILSLLDDLTMNGLSELATIVRGCSILHGKTRSKMKKTIKENLVKIHQRRCPEDKGCQICSHLSKFICNPNNFCRNHAMLLAPTVQTHFGAIMSVLNSLDDMPFATLSAMHRRLKGLPGTLPLVVHNSRHGWSKNGLVAAIRKQALCLLASLDEQDDIPVPLMKAMAVASLSRKLDNVGKPVIVSFRDYAPDVEDLHDKLIKAINLLGRKVKVPELDAIRDLMFKSPQSELLHTGLLRKTVKRILMDLLFECSEFDAIPTTMLDAVAVLNTSLAMRSSSKMSKDVIEGEVESILRVSAHIKQMLWDFFPDAKVELDYADAYMEELEESDNVELSNDFNDSEQLGKHDKGGSSVQEQLNEEVGSTAFGVHVNPLSSGNISSADKYCTPTPYKNTGSMVKLEPHLEKDTDFCELASASSLQMRENFGHTKIVIGGDISAVKSSVVGSQLKVSYEEQIELSEHLQKSNAERDSACHLITNESSIPSGAIVQSESKSCFRNQYLALQDLSDETGLVSYQIIGQVLHDFALADGLTLNSEDQVYLNGSSSTSTDLQDGISNGNEALSDKETAGISIVKAVQKFIPTFPHSKLEEAKAFLKL